MKALLQRPLGTSGLRITQVGFGAWAIGGGGWAYGWGSQDDTDSIAAIRHAVARGINWVDTAAIYVRPDRRTPEERRRENEEMLRQLPALLKPEVYRQLVDLVGPDDYWTPILKAGLDQETYLDITEAIVTIWYEAKNALR
jgi:hypothetical protein